MIEIQVPLLSAWKGGQEGQLQDRGKGSCPLSSLWLQSSLGSFLQSVPSGVLAEVLLPTYPLTYNIKYVLNRLL